MLYTTLLNFISTIICIVPFLFQHMLEKNTTYIKNDTIEKLSCHDWSGKDEKHFAGKLKVIKYKNIST